MKNQKYLRYRRRISHMNMGEKLSDQSNGLNYADHTYMVAGYIKDYKPLYGEDPDGGLTMSDFKENKGYVDDNGFVHIFRENPDPKEIIPWFTVQMSPNTGKPFITFNKRKNQNISSAFRIEHVGDLSISSIIKNTTDGPVQYSADVANDIARATSTFIPEINENDDFLKKLVKQIILEKGVNIHKYKQKLPKSSNLPNLQQALRGSTKMSPRFFITWMELLQCDFTVTIRDSGLDREDPLRKSITFDSEDGRIRYDDGSEVIGGEK